MLFRPNAPASVKGPFLSEPSSNSGVVSSKVVSAQLCSDDCIRDVKFRLVPGGWSNDTGCRTGSKIGAVNPSVMSWLVNRRTSKAVGLPWATRSSGSTTIPGPSVRPHCEIHSSKPLDVCGSNSNRSRPSSATKLVMRFNSSCSMDSRGPGIMRTMVSSRRAGSFCKEPRATWYPCASRFCLASDSPPRSWSVI